MAEYLTVHLKTPFDQGEAELALNDYLEDRSEEEEEKKERKRELSPLHSWCSLRAFPESVSLSSLSTDLESFSLSSEIDRISRTISQYDVTLLMAPTGSGKSLLAPMIFKRYLEDRRSFMDQSNPRFDETNKCLMMVPNGEAVGATTRMCTKLYMQPETRCEIAGFYSTYEQVLTSKKIPGGKVDSGPREFNITTYEFGEKLLSESFLSLLILDESHESNPNIVLSIAAALRMLTGDGRRKKRRLERLLLMTATMNERDIKLLKGTFEDESMSFKLLDLNEIPRNKEVVMSCMTTLEDVLPTDFSRTLQSLAMVHDQRNIYGREEKGGEPNYYTIESRLLRALEYAMGEAGREIEEGGKKDVPSIVVILPGLEPVERLFARVRSMNNFKVPVHIRDSTGMIIKSSMEEAFQPIRITSTVKDDLRVTSPCENLGSWGGKKGRIIFSTNMIASGLTIPGAAFIIDCGVIKLRSEYERNGCFSLDTQFIDREMMIQRAGRTGRTHDGEYFVALSSKRIDEIEGRNVKREQMMRQFDENHWFRMKIHQLNLPWTPDSKIFARFQKSFETRGYLVSGLFTPLTLHMADLFPFLPPDMSRLLVQGIRLGLAAHIIYYIADMMTSIKLVPPATKGRENQGGPSDKCSATDRFARVMYKGMADYGDSIARADYITSFFHAASIACTHYRFDVNMVDENAVPEGNFWRGDWTKGELPEPRGFKGLYSLFVRDEGRESLLRYARQLEGAARGAGVLKGGEKGVFSPSHNRYWRGENDCCLNKDGRTLFMAILTLHSSRIGKRLEPRFEEIKGEVVQREQYAVYDKLLPEAPWIKTTVIEPERMQWEGHNGMPYGRYTEAFQRGPNGNYVGCVDPISNLHVACFLNISSKLVISLFKPDTKTGKHKKNDVGKIKIGLELNGAPAKMGVEFAVSTYMGARITDCRALIQNATEAMLVEEEEEEDLVRPLARALIEMWRGCEEGEERMKRSEG